MFLISLALGSLSIVFPFIALVLIMLYCGKHCESIFDSQNKTLLPMFIVPVAIAIFSPQKDTIFVVADSIFGVCLVVFGFMNMFRKQLSVAKALALSTAILVLYGSVRMHLFASNLDAGLEQAIQTMQSRFPTLINDTYGQQSLQFMKMFLPSIWVVQMIFALLAGLVLFQRQIRLPFVIERFSVSKYYSLILLFVIPLYLMEGSQVILINSLISYSVIPFIQGVCLIIHKANKIVSNPYLIGFIIFFILINAVSYIIIPILGIADQWLDFRKIENGGISNESHYA